MEGGWSKNEAAIRAEQRREKRTIEADDVHGECLDSLK
jgi:hypothetical protein